MAVSASSVKELREKTGAGMMDCKKALNETGGDIEEAITWLRKKGLAAAAKKAGRVAAEGLVAVAVDGNKGAMIELNAETDFVARNEQFQGLVNSLADIALNYSNLDEMLAGGFPGSERNVSEEIVHNISVIGENINLRRIYNIEVSSGLVASYIHNSVAPNLGKIAVLIGMESTASKEVLENLGKQIAMHIAAAKPDALTIDAVDPANLEKEKSIIWEQSRASGKPDNIIEKMMEGRIRKYYEEVVLLEQIFVIDGKSKVKDIVAAAEKESGTEIRLKDFQLYILGDGVEKEESDFAAEVAAAAGK